MCISHGFTNDVQVNPKEPQSTQLTVNKDQPEASIKPLLEGIIISQTLTIVLNVQFAQSFCAGSQTEWHDDANLGYSAAGERDILILVSDVSTTDNPDIVPRRCRGPLTEKERRKLEKQGIHQDYCHNDLCILTARGTLDDRFTLVDVPAGRTTCEGIKSRITKLMNETQKGGGN